MPIDILKAFREQPPPIDFVLPGFAMSTVGALIAPGATGKSIFALQMAMSIACSVAGGDLIELNPDKTGNVLYLNCEDPQNVILNRLHSVGQHLDSDAQLSISKNLMLESLMGKGLNIGDDRHRERIIGVCEQINVRLIIFDTLNRIHQLDENSNSHAAQIIGFLEQIAARSGAAVMFLHHVSKASAMGGMAELQQAARGASALIDNARWCGYVAKMTKDEAKGLSDRQFDHQPINPDYAKNYIRFGVSKQNYGQPVSERWFKFHDGGVLMPVHLFAAEKETKAKSTIKGLNNEDW